MSPLLAAALGSILRHFLTMLSGYLVAHGVWHQDEAGAYVAGAVAALLTIAYSIWQKYKGRLRFLVALQMPSGTTEAEVKEIAGKG